MPIRLTDSPAKAKKDAALGARLIKDLPAPERGSKIYYDGDPTGFAVRVTAGGVRTFVMSYTVRTNGIRRLRKIGRHGPNGWTVTEARAEAKDLRKQIDAGGDPMGELHAARAAPTVADLADLYCEERLPSKRPKTQEEDRAMLRLFVLPAHGRLKVASVDHADIARLHRKLKDRPIRANRVTSLCSRLFNLAIREKMRLDNPARGVERNDEERRERYLSQAELVRLTEALGKYPNQKAADVIRLLLLTGARRGEVLGMEWTHVDLEAGIWTKPSSHTKTKKIHRVPLNAAALEVLSNIKAESETDFVFPSDRRPGRPLEDVKNAWPEIMAQARIKNFRPHDLRHTYATILASANLSLHLIGALLGHTRAETTRRYAHLQDDALRAATERVGAIVSAAGKPGAEIIELSRRGT